MLDAEYSFSGTMNIFVSIEKIPLYLLDMIFIYNPKYSTTHIKIYHLNKITFSSHQPAYDGSLIKHKEKRATANAFPLFHIFNFI